jgi:hypothetical protein
MAKFTRRWFEVASESKDGHSERPAKRKKKSVKKREPKVQWDVGYIPNNSAFNRCRILIREERIKERRKQEHVLYTVYAIGYEGNERRVIWKIGFSDCVKCAEACALGVIRGDPESACPEHGVWDWEDGARHGCAAVICCLMGIGPRLFRKSSYASRVIYDGVAWRVGNGRLGWESVVKAIDITKRFKWVSSSSSVTELDNMVRMFYAVLKKLTTKK